MATWEEFDRAAPDLAAFGASRFAAARVAYLATVDATGTPRVHPMTPIISGGRLFVFMEPTSPKGHDLRRDPRYAIHSQVENEEGGAGEFFVSGAATPVDEPTVRASAAAEAGYDVLDRYVLFELSVDRASSTRYDDGTKRSRWP